jgi:outer membrane protein assembly factor BamB
VAICAQGQIVYGLHLADGHHLWSRVFSQDIVSMWRWQNLVVVATEQTDRSQPPQPGLAALDASTGQTRWMLPKGEAWSYVTADGGMTVTVERADGILELLVVDLSSGRVRWTRPVGSDLIPPVAVGGGTVVFAENSQLTSYDDRTGQIRWTKALRPGISLGPGGFLTSGLLYLTGQVQESADGPMTQVLLGISATDGHVQWRFAYSFQESRYPYAPGLMSVMANAYSRLTQDELNPATGRIRWRVVSPYRAIATRAGIVTSSGPHRIRMRDRLTGQTRWTVRLKRGWLPLVIGPEKTSAALPVFPVGSLLVLPAVGPGSDLLAAFRISDGHREWQVTIPGPVADPLSAVHGGILVYTI